MICRAAFEALAEEPVLPEGEVVPGVEPVPEDDEAKSCFTAAANGLVELVRQVGPQHWGRPALGEWDVRALVGHASRALSTVETYLRDGRTTPAHGGRGDTGPVLDDPVDYFLVALAAERDADARHRHDAAIAERGRQAGASLGDDPARAVGTLAERVIELVAASAGDDPVATPFGTMTLDAYLPTRTFELSVHSLDLARALALAVPGVLDRAITASCELAGRLAGRRDAAPELLLLLTGRSGLPGNLSAL